MRCGVGEGLAAEMHLMHRDFARMSRELRAAQEELERVRSEKGAKTDSLVNIFAKSGVGMARAKSHASAWADRGRDAARAEAAAAEAARLAAEEEARRAATARAAADAEVERLTKALADAQGDGKDAARLAAEAARAEATRLAAAEAAAKKLAFISRMEAERTEQMRAAAEKAAAERAEHEAQRAKLAAEKEAAEAEAAAASQRADRLSANVEAAKAERDRISAEKAAVEEQAVRDLEAAALAAERAAYAAFCDAWRAAPANRRGKLTLTIVSASGLKQAAVLTKKGVDLSQLSALGASVDPYCVVAFGKVTEKTPTVAKTLAPEWNATIALGEVTIADLLFGTALLTVKDEVTSAFSKDYFGNSDSDLGQARVRLAELEKEKTHTYTVAMGGSGSGAATEGHGKLTFSASFEALPSDQAAMRSSYEKTGRSVPPGESDLE